MSICYECYETGRIVEKEIDYPSQFSTVKKYNGTGRMGLDLADRYKRNLTEEEKVLVNRMRECAMTTPLLMI